MNRKYKTNNKKLNIKVLFRALFVTLVTLRLPYYFFKLILYYTVNHCAALAGGIRIGKNTNIHPTVLIREPQNIEIGKNCYFNHNTILNGGHHIAKLIIGNDVQSGPNVCFYCSNHNYDNKKIPIKNQGYWEADIIIEDDVWIGANSVITSGVRIGKGAVIGAGSIVTKDIPPFSIAAGNPAKVIKSR